MSNSDIENKVYFGPIFGMQLVTDMLRKPILDDNFVTALLNYILEWHFIFLGYNISFQMPKNAKIYTCQDCDFKCFKLSNYNLHLSTLKHKKLTNPNINLIEKLPKSKYVCSCGKEYKHASTLSKHKKHCSGVSKESSEALGETNKLVFRLLQENKEMREALQQQQDQHQKQIQELIPKLQQVTTINNTNSNNTTNKFNLNFFLNEQCKDAISIQTFIENLDIGIKELEHMGNVGYLQGMMTIMSNTLGAMDVYKRPVHCTDLKRETVYIKDGDTWKKDNANNDDLKRVINTVANVNYRNLDVWESQHPDAFESDTPDNIEYCRIAMESMGGYDNSDDKIAIKLNKLIKHVVREVYVK